MKYLVRAVPREGHDGRNRDGKRFSSVHPTELDESELTQGIREDPYLIVEPVIEGPLAEGEAASRLLELKAEVERLHQANAEICSVNGELCQANDELQEQKSELEAEVAELKAIVEGLQEQLAAKAEQAEELEETVQDLEADLKAEEKDDLDGFTVAQLKALAAEKGIEVPSDVKRAQLLAALKAVA